MTTNEITDQILRSMFERGFITFCTNFSGVWYQETDVIGVNNNEFVYEYEIKRSMSDFYNEFRNKKYKHYKLAGGNIDEVNMFGYPRKINIPNRYFFVCEKDLIPLEKIPKYAGLVYIEKKEWADCRPTYYIEFIKRAPLLHNKKVDNMLYKAIASSLSTRMVTGSSYHAYKQNELNNL